VNHQTAQTHRQHGVTLIELMVALVIGLILTAGAVQIFLGSKETYRTSEALSRVQENGRMALQLLGQDIRQADYKGCQDNLTDVNNQLNDDSSDYQPLANGGVDVSDDGGPNNSDGFTLRSAGTNENLYLTQQPSDTSAGLTVNRKKAVEEGAIMIITDCRSADLFQVSNDPVANDSNQINHNQKGSLSPGNAQQGLSKVYEPGSMTLQFRQFRYAITQDDESGRNFLTRFIDEDTSASDEEDLIPGVVDFQLTYGVDNDGDAVADYYVSGGDISSEADEEEIVAVHVDLVVQSEATNVTTDTGQQTFTLDDGTDSGKPVNIQDGRLAQRFTGTYTLRNRVR